MGLLDAGAKALRSLQNGLTAVSTLDLRDVACMSPARLERAGKVASTLHDAGFADEKVIQIVRALFCAELLGSHEAEQQMERAFDVWDRDHRGVLDLAEFSRDLSALLAGDLEPHERQALVDGLSADGSDELEYEGFREVMLAVGADDAERHSRLAALRSYGDDVGLARTAVGVAQASHMSRHELRVAGALVRVMQRERYAAEDMAALLPALGLASPSEVQLRAAFRVFDPSGKGEALDAEHLRERLSLLVPQAARVVWGEGMASGVAATGHDSSRPLGEGIGLINFDEFCPLLAQLRGALASQALAAGVSIKPQGQSGWLGQLTSSVSHSTVAWRAMPLLETIQLPPERLLQCGTLIAELESAGLCTKAAAAVARVLFLRHDPEAAREAFSSLDLKRSGVVPMARLRWILPSLVRHLPAKQAEARLAAALAETSDARGLELADFAQLLASLSVATEGSEGVVAEALTGLSASLDGAVSEGVGGLPNMGGLPTMGGLSPLQLQRVGRIARRMQHEDYPPTAIHAVIRCLFISASKSDLERAFHLLDREHVGSLDAAQLRVLLTVAGEKTSAQNELSSWFSALDRDGSGRLELPEVSRLLRALRRAISTGPPGSAFSALSKTLSHSMHSLQTPANALDTALLDKLAPVERRRARRVADALHQAEFAPAQIRAIVASRFGQLSTSGALMKASEATMRAAFDAFDREGDGALDADEFREMLHLLAGDEPLGFAQVESLFLEADRDRSGTLEFTEFAWLLLHFDHAYAPAPVPPKGGAGAGADASASSTLVRPVFVKSVDELKQDRRREGQQKALTTRAERLRIKADTLARASQLLYQERPLVCAELLMRLHKVEKYESRALLAADPDAKSQTGEGLLLRGSPALLERRAEVVLRALASVAVEDRTRALEQMRQAIQSIDEELPVTETAAVGIGRARGLQARADRMALVIELLGASSGLPQAITHVAELMASLQQEEEMLSSAPPALARGTEEPLRQLRRRLAAFSQLQLQLQNKALAAAKQHAISLATRLRADAAKVTEYASQGIYVPPGVTPLPLLEPAEAASPPKLYAMRWARARELLRAAEKVGQVLHHVRTGKRRSLQTAVQLLMTIEEVDLPQLFKTCMEVVQLTDQQQQNSKTRAGGPRAKQADGSVALAVTGGGLRDAAAEYQATVWWHQIDEGEGNDSYEVVELADWVSAKDLKRARLQLMRRGGIDDGIAALEKMRNDLLLFARDAC